MLKPTPNSKKTAPFKRCGKIMTTNSIKDAEPTRRNYKQAFVIFGA
jgi:hypothetical protein